MDHGLSRALEKKLYQGMDGVYRNLTLQKFYTKLISPGIHISLGGTDIGCSFEKNKNKCRSKILRKTTPEKKKQKKQKQQKKKQQNVT